jgi:hypothetical protein
VACFLFEYIGSRKYQNLIDTAISKTVTELEQIKLVVNLNDINDLFEDEDLISGVIIGDRLLFTKYYDRLHSDYS